MGEEHIEDTGALCLHCGLDGRFRHRNTFPKQRFKSIDMTVTDSFGHQPRIPRERFWHTVRLVHFQERSDGFSTSELYIFAQTVDLIVR
ncbi:hypothetical protein LTR54_002336 [Friedmanniomyces endolithicus]|uniref:Uncharacterized protein n=1 Tax=Friedmanniomyces endolithicus TaxID=329885 RepID=A0AAN6G1A6_9PEZI|nr:hypothetical protein LTR82_002566 [Friedmanniomyces endolithicus]KAK1017677.1 hypothetical protein LTR54_002336 [Friedmanniomyces endolithicus]